MTKAGLVVVAAFAGVGGLSCQSDLRTGFANAGAAGMSGPGAAGHAGGSGGGSGATGGVGPGAGGTAAAGGASGAAGGSSPSFRTGVNYPAGPAALTSVASIAAADLDGDGDLDLVAAREGLGARGDVAVLLNRGDGSFELPVSYLAGIAPRSVAIGDFNGDGTPDLAVANSGSGTVSILTNDGAGRFAAATDQAVGLAPWFVAAADLDRDGRIDLVVTTYGDATALERPGGAVNVLRNTGGGRFAAPVAFAAGVNPSSVAPADLDGDGDVDLAVANFSDDAAGTVSVLVNDGRGAFGAPVDYAGGVGPEWIAAGDLDGDGRPDLAISNAGGSSTRSVDLMFNNGDGTFAKAVSYNPGYSCAQMAIADVDRDGKMDVVVGSDSDQGVYVLAGNGDRTFVQPLAPSTIHPDVGSRAVAVGDLNGDGLLDFAVGGWKGGIGIFLNVGTKVFAAAGSYEVRGVSPRAVAAADVDGDGNGDIVLAGNLGPSTSIRAGTVGVLLGKGDGSFAPAVNYAAGWDPAAVAISDLDGDGRPDLVTVNRTGGDVSVLLNRGGGAFAAAVGYAAGGGPVAVAIGDLDGNGSPDLAVANMLGNTVSSAVSGNVSVFLNRGAGAFGAATSYPAGLNPIAVAIGDTDDDGRGDLIVVNGGGTSSSSLLVSGSVSVLPNLGGGRFGASVAYATDPRPVGAVLGDLNGDGRLDLAISSADLPDPPGRVQILLGTEGGGFKQVHEWGVGTGPFSMAMGDMDGDGRSDLVVQSRRREVLSVLLNPGGGAFAFARDYAIGDAPVGVALADFNSDGRLDVAVANSSSGDVSVLLNDGMGDLGAAHAFGMPGSPTAAAIDDLNGDGWPDMAVLANNYAPIGADLSVFFGAGDGSLVRTGPYAIGKTSFTSSGPAALADVSGDGKADFVVCNGYAKTLSLLVNDGRGAFAWSSDYPIPEQAAAIATGDLNGDGRADVVVAIDPYQGVGGQGVGVLLGQSGGGLGVAAALYPVTRGARPRTVGIADLNGDGRADVVVASYLNTALGHVDVFLNAGNGTLAAPVGFPSGNIAPSIALQDLNGDGKTDLALPIYATGMVSVFLNRGDGTFGAAADFPAGVNPSFIAAGDLDGDGKPELAVTNAFTAQVTVLSNLGGGRFGPGVPFAAGASPVGVMVRDMNGDGRQDLAVINIGSLAGSVTLLLNTTP